MAHRIYTDHCVDGAIVSGLLRRGVDVLTAQQDEHHFRIPDPVVLDRATELERIVFTQDEDFLVDVAARQRSGEHFYGVIYGPQRRGTVGRYIEDIEVLVKLEGIENLVDRVTYLPI